MLLEIFLVSFLSSQSGRRSSTRTRSFHFLFFLFDGLDITNIRISLGEFVSSSPGVQLILFVKLYTIVCRPLRPSLVLDILAHNNFENNQVRGDADYWRTREIAHSYIHTHTYRRIHNCSEERSSSFRALTCVRERKEPAKTRRRSSLLVQAASGVCVCVHTNAQRRGGEKKTQGERQRQCHTHKEEKQKGGPKSEIYISLAEKREDSIALYHTNTLPSSVVLILSPSSLLPLLLPPPLLWLLSGRRKGRVIAVSERGSICRLAAPARSGRCRAGNPCSRARRCRRP